MKKLGLRKFAKNRLKLATGRGNVLQDCGRNNAFVYALLKKGSHPVVAVLCSIRPSLMFKIEKLSSRHGKNAMQILFFCCWCWLLLNSTRFLNDHCCKYSFLFSLLSCEVMSCGVGRIFFRAISCRSSQFFFTVLQHTVTLSCEDNSSTMFWSVRVASCSIQDIIFCVARGVFLEIYLLLGFGNYWFFVSHCIAVLILLIPKIEGNDCQSESSQKKQKRMQCCSYRFVQLCCIFEAPCKHIWMRIELNFTFANLRFAPAKLKFVQVKLKFVTAKVRWKRFRSSSNWDIWRPILSALFYALCFRKRFSMFFGYQLEIKTCHIVGSVFAIFLLFV